MNVLSIISWIGTACFIACSVPQTVACIRTRSAGTLTWAFLLLWLAGCVFLSVFTASQGAWALLANYAFSLLNAGVIVVLKAREARRAP